jgi:hypothetical protein
MAWLDGNQPSWRTLLGLAGTLLLLGLSRFFYRLYCVRSMVRRHAREYDIVSLPALESLNEI